MAQRIVDTAFHRARERLAVGGRVPARSKLTNGASAAELRMDSELSRVFNKFLLLAFWFSCYGNCIARLGRVGLPPIRGGEV
jgi:hypothetical protein